MSGCRTQSGLFFEGSVINTSMSQTQGFSIAKMQSSSDLSVSSISGQSPNLEDYTEKVLRQGQRENWIGFGYICVFFL